MIDVRLGLEHINRVGKFHIPKDPQPLDQLEVVDAKIGGERLLLHVLNTPMRLILRQLVNMIH